MRHFALTIRFPTGGPLIGGTAATPEGYHAHHAARGEAPYLPATALRGALREALEAVLRGSGEHRACAGGTGLEPDHEPPEPAAPPSAEPAAGRDAAGSTRPQSCAPAVAQPLPVPSGVRAVIEKSASVVR